MASSSPMNSSFPGSNLSLRLSIQANAAAWQAVWDRRMTWELAAGFARDLTQSKKFRAWAETSSPPSRLAITSFNSALSDAGCTSMPPLSPVSTQPPSPTNRTGQVPSDWIHPGRWPKGVSRQSITSFTPLA